MNHDLNTILAEYDDAADRAEATGGAGARPDLREWVRRYPEFRDEVVRYAVDREILERGRAFAPPQPDAHEAFDAFVARADRIAEQVRQARAPARAKPGVQHSTAAADRRLTSIVDAARERGMTVPALAQALRLTPLEVSKLNQRLFTAATLPRSLVERLAELLGRTSAQVASYLRLPPTLAAGAAYKAAAAPRVGEQVEFVAAVRANRALDAESRAYWEAASADMLGDDGI